MADSQQEPAKTIGEIEQEARQVLKLLNSGPPVDREPMAGSMPTPISIPLPVTAGPDKWRGDRVEMKFAAAGKFNPLAMSGSRDSVLARGLGDKVVRCVGLSPDMSAEERDRRVGAAAAAMRELAPRNPAEGLLVAQMVAAHSAGLDRLARAADMERPAEATELHSRQAARLMGLFARQYDLLLRNRERKRRTLRIEHVRMTADGKTSVQAEEERSR